MYARIGDLLTSSSPLRYAGSMHEFLSQHRYHVVTGVILLVLSVWWVLVQGNSATEADRQLFSAFYGLMALWGALWGIKTAFEWGGFKSLFGKAILMFSFGLLAQEFGQLAYSYYANFLHVEIPYPSVGDLGYFGSIPLYAYGAFLLAQTAGIKFAIQSIFDRLKIIAFPLTLLLLSYTLFLRGYEPDWSHPLMMFLDFGYPLGQAVYISIAIMTYVMCRKFLGGIMRSRVILILIAFVLQYAADFMFLYQNSTGTWEGGRLNDYMYLVAYTAMTLALLELRHVIQRLRK